MLHGTVAGQRTARTGAPSLYGKLHAKGGTLIGKRFSNMLIRGMPPGHIVPCITKKGFGGRDRGLREGHFYIQTKKYGEPRGAPGCPRKPQGGPGKPRKPQKAPGGPRKLQEAPESLLEHPGALLGPPGASWGFLDVLGPSGASWGLLEPSGASWGLLRPSVASWASLGLPRVS